MAGAIKYVDRQIFYSDNYRRVRRIDEDAQEREYAGDGNIEYICSAVILRPEYDVGGIRDERDTYGITERIEYCRIQ